MTFGEMQNYTFEELQGFTFLELGLISAIFDRTLQDVTDKTAKGLLNYTDMNRIETALESITTLFSISYTQKTWVRGELPLQTHYEKWKTAMDSIKSAYDVLLTVPIRPYLDYTKLNNLEYFLYYTDLIFSENELDKPYCGEFYCGEWGLI